MQGFDALDWDYAADRDRAVSTDGPVFARLRELTRETGVDILFGFLERAGEKLYSSCALLGGGQLLHLYRRISRGWKVYWRTDGHYRAGENVETFLYRGRRCAIALCGDLWDFPERFRLGQDLLFWPVYISYSVEDWTGGEREEYARQAARAGGEVLLVNAITDRDEEPAHGGCYWFSGGAVRAELPMGGEGLLVVNLFDDTITSWKTDQRLHKTLEERLKDYYGKHMEAIGCVEGNQEILWGEPMGDEVS